MWADRDLYDGAPSTRERVRHRNSFTSPTNDWAPSPLSGTSLPRPSLVLYLVKVSSFLTDFTPAIPRAISEALALAPIVHVTRKRLRQSWMGGECHNTLRLGAIARPGYRTFLQYGEGTIPAGAERGQPGLRARVRSELLALRPTRPIP